MGGLVTGRAGQEVGKYLIAQSRRRGGLGKEGQDAELETGLALSPCCAGASPWLPVPVLFPPPPGPSAPSGKLHGRLETLEKPRLSGREP